MRIDQVQDLLALTGDSSDNIPGVPSVGPKTAKDLLVEFGSLHGIYQRIDEIKKKGLKDKLVEHKEMAFLSQRLVKLKDDCPIIIDHAHLAYGGRDIPALKVLYAELGFQRQLQASVDRGRELERERGGTPSVVRTLIRLAVGDRRRTDRALQRTRAHRSRQSVLPRSRWS